MSNFRDFTGETFGRLKVLGLSHEKFYGRLKVFYWDCICICGKLTKVQSSNLRSGSVRSCKCLQKDVDRSYFITHGKTNTPEHKSWECMKSRCNGVNNTKYKDYGGRGIKVCDSWSDPINGFSNFLKDMGPKPTPEHSLDRLEVNGNYEPSNCKWSTVNEQNMNRRNTVRILFEDKLLTIPEWSTLTGISESRIRSRYYRNLSVDKIFSKTTLK